METIKQLRKSILVFSVLSIFIVGVVVAIAALYPLYHQLKKDEESDLLHAATSRKMAIEQFLGKLEQTAWQITSRTKAREKLEQFNQGEVGLKQFVDFSKPILEDALRLSEQAVGCLRFDKNGQPVVQAGLPLPESFRVLPRQEESRARLHGPVLVDDALYIVVGAPIFDREKVQVGTDLVMFQLDELRKIVQDDTGLEETGETILGMVADKTRVRLFFTPRKTAEKYGEYVNIASPLGLAMAQASQLGRDESRLFTSPMDHSQVFAYASIGNIHNWAMVLHMNAEELYAPMNRQILTICFVLFALLLLGTFGTMLLLRPLAGKIVIHTEQLESMTQRLVQEADERRRLNRELDQRVLDRTAQLEAANKELEAFAYSISHDLRAPLRHIDGFIGLLQKRTASALDEKSRHYMEIISGSAKHMGNLIDDLLAFSRMGRQTLSLQPVDLGNLARDVIRELEPDAADRNINWRIGDLPVVSGDRTVLRIVLANLVSNAVKFTQPRTQAEIEIGWWRSQEAETVVFVRDNGVGFDMTYADKLFGVFQRLHRPEDFEGTGIGLANVRRIINRHGGRTWAEGEVDQGATFYFSLPQKIQEA